MKKNLVDCSFHIGKWLKTNSLTMKLLLFLLVAGSMTLSASSYAQIKKIDLHCQNSSMTDIFSSIEKSSEFIFLYNDEIIDDHIKKTFAVEGEKIERILDQLLEGTEIAYKIDDRQIFLYKKDDLKQLEELKSGSRAQSEQPQKKSLNGRITDVKGFTVPGATVVVKGTTVGANTDMDGNFAIQAPADSKTIIISFVGYKTQEIDIGNQSTFHVVLDEMTVGLEEVVAVGYGVQKKESIVGAITQTSNEQLKRSGGVTDLKQALTGNLPGVVTITSSGEPGGAGTGQSATSIFIRGQNTWNGGQPLILVDGVERNMDNIDVNEVETISVLKDASATAVFGVKGANGVILITTKRGTIGKAKISFSYNTTAKMISKLPKKLDSYNTFLKKNEAIEREVVLNEPSWADYKPNEIVDRYKLPQSAEYAAIYPNIDWENAMFKDVGMSHHATMSVQGGTNFVNYFGSFAYLHEGDMFKKYDNGKGYDPSYAFDRFNFRSNLDFRLTNTTSLKVNLAGFYALKNTDYDYREDSGINPYAWAAAYALPPDAYLPQYADGRWGVATYIPAEQMPNPVATVYNTGIRENRQTQLNSDFSLEQKLDFITKGLSAKASLFYDNTILAQGGLNDVTNMVRPEPGGNTPSKYVYSNLYTGPDQDPNIYISNAPISGVNQFDWVVRPWWINQETILASEVTRRTMLQFQLNYARKFGKHSVSAMGLVKREEYAKGSMFKNFREDWVFRTTYDYDSRYLFEINGAYNGSEQFGPGYRFAFFPSMALGWVVTNEKFFKVDWINRLKLRFSIGSVGDDNVSGGRWLYSSQYSYGGYSEMNQNPNQASPYTWYKEATIGNPDIHWEKAEKSNYGLEMGLFKNLITLNFDYFTENRTDILLAGGSRPSIPSFFGNTPPSANVGQVKAHGQEIELKFDKRFNDKFRYWATIAMTHTINKVIAKDDPLLLAAYSKAQGFQIGQTRSQISTGFYSNWDKVYASIPQESNDLAKLPGFYNIADFNADGIIKSDDSAPIGYPETPQNSYNTSLGAEYKGFNIMLQFYGVTNVSRNIPLRNYHLYTDVLFEHVMDSWSKDNPNATSYLPRWKTQGQFIGDYWIFDGSYLRLKTAEIAYTFRDNFVKTAGLSALRIYLNGENLWFWSHLPDDREAALTGGSSNEGSYPTVKRVNLGIDITF